MSPRKMATTTACTIVGGLITAAAIASALYEARRWRWGIGG